jgi:L-lysine 6-transaminase
MERLSQLRPAQVPQTVMSDPIHVPPSEVHEVLQRHQLADGLPFVFDLERSHGAWLVDARTGEEYLDFFTCFASWPVGYNHPALEEPAFQKEIARAAIHNPSNSDLYTSAMAEFVQAFATRVTPPGFPHHFWVSGGALAVENALKTAFDWKARKKGLANVEDDGASLVVLHFRQGFHGRSGYTLSITSTDPKKTALFPKFDWPRVHNPAIEFDLEGRIANDVAAEEARACREIEAAFERYEDRIAAIVIEPMQSEGGDNHFRTEFLRALRRYADEREALLVFDEVQTGFFGSGLAWLWQHHEVAPDVVAFGKKTQVCGIYASARVDEVPDNVFRKAGRINSTWGGNLTDMVRCRRFIEIIEREELGPNIARMGERFLAGLRALAAERRELSNVRGIGSLCAFTMPSTEDRQAMLERLRDARLLALSSGERSVRFRLPLVVSADEVDTALRRVEAALPARVRG